MADDFGLTTPQLAREHDRLLTLVDYFRHRRLRATVPPCPTTPALLL
jgi:hypothetical protein